jgi:hypothetical protein
MNKQFLKDSLGWGFGLWVFGYVLGFVFFAFVPPTVIGWYIMPFGVALTLWVLLKKVQGGDCKYYFSLALVWTLLAVVLDYFLLVKLFKPADGYYKLDVYVYYLLTFLLPLAAGWWRLRNKS